MATARRGRPRFRLLHPAARGHPLADALRRPHFTDPHPGQGYYSFVSTVLLGDRRRVRGADGRARAHVPSACSRRGRCARTAGSATSSWPRRARPPGRRSGDDGARAAPMWALFEGSIWLAVLFGAAASRRRRLRSYSERPMARAAVKAKQQAKKARSEKAPARRLRPAPPRSRRQPEPAALLHRLRRQAKPVVPHPRGPLRRHVRVPRRRIRRERRARPALLGPQHLLERRHLGLEGAEGDPEAPERGEGLPRPRDRLRGEGRHAERDLGAPAVHEQKPKDAAAWNELGGLQLTQAQSYLTQYQAASQAAQLAAPSTAFLPTASSGRRSARTSSSSRPPHDANGRPGSPVEDAARVHGLRRVVPEGRRRCSRTMRTPGSSSRRPPSSRATQDRGRRRTSAT